MMKRLFVALMAMVITLGVLPPVVLQAGTDSASTPCRWIGSGSIIQGDLRVTHGFKLHCSVDQLPNNLQVNWGGNHFHLTQLTAVVSSDNTAIDPKPPRGGCDTYHGWGVGKYDGVDGYQAEWIFTDAGEPGRGDWAWIKITAPNGDTVMEVKGHLKSGNHQVKPLFKLIRTVQITPDATFHVASFPRINYVPATDQFVVTFGTVVDKQNCLGGAGYAYKGHTLDMQETGKSGYFIFYPDQCSAGDSGSVMVDNTYYGAFAVRPPGVPYGWHLAKFDAVTWTLIAETNVLLEAPHEADMDPTVAYVNGQLDISDQYNPNGAWQEGSASHHNFYSTDLQPLGKKFLADTALISGASMIYADGIYYIITANDYAGDLVVAKYDSDWNYLGVTELRKQAHWSQGVAFDGQLFYVSYLDTSQRDPGPFIGHFYPNVHLAAFDRDWNLVDDVAVTNFTHADHKFPGRPWVIIHNNRLYVSYDMNELDPDTHQDLLETQQAFVSICELTPYR